MASFSLLERSGFDQVAAGLFAILAGNMAVIAPTGNTYGEDYRIWYTAVADGMRKEARNIVLIHQDALLIGFFQYYTNDDGLLMMEEIQIIQEFQGGKFHVFRELYGYLFFILPPGLTTVEAFANKANVKSQRILSHLGLSVVGENRSGSSFHYRGEFDKLVEWYRNEGQYRL